MRTKPFSDLRSRKSAAAQPRAQKRTRAMLVEMDAAATGKRQ